MEETEEKKGLAEVLVEFLVNTKFNLSQGV